MSKYDYDLVVIGGGSAGISSANLALNLGKKVALVEKAKIGGDCTWYGCVPSKALIKASKIAHEAKSLNDYGLKLQRSSGIDTNGVMAHVRRVRESVYQEEKPEVFIEKGIDVYIGEVRFLDNHHLQLADKSISANKFIIATGSGPFIPEFEGIGDLPFLTNENIFELDVLPRSLLVLGGGPIGTELAAALNRLGVMVTIIEKGDQILPREDAELAHILMECLREEGVDIITQSRGVKLVKDGDQVALTVQQNNGTTRAIKGDQVLIALGRRPNIKGLDLDKAGVRVNKRGIVTDATLKTTAANIYACGDVIGSYQFSHIAEYHAGIAVPNALLPLPIKRKVDYDNIVWATFTDPEFAHAGLTEQEARHKYGDSVRVYRHEYKQVDRAKTDGAVTGLSKFVVDRKGKLLGIHILGERASELLHEAQLAKSLGVPFSKIQSMIHIYPTYGDMVKRPAVRAYVDRLQNNFFIKLAKKFKK